MTPERLPVLPLRDVVLFPYVVMPLLVGRPASLAALEAANGEERLVLLVAQRDRGDRRSRRRRISTASGVIARVRQLAGSATARRRSSSRASRARASRATCPGGELPARRSSSRCRAPTVGRRRRPRRTCAARCRCSRSTSRCTAGSRPRSSTLIQGADSPARQAFGIAAHLGTRLDARQALLEVGRRSPPCSSRARRHCSTQRDRAARVSSARSTTTCAARSSRTSASSTCRSSSRRSTASSGRRTATTSTSCERSSRRRGCPSRCRRARCASCASCGGCRRCRPSRRSPATYLDWIVALPWTERTDDVLDVAHARQVLDEDHYGLEDVKDRILDYIGVLSLVERLDGPDPLSRRAAGRRQDVARPLDRAGARAQVRAHVARRRARRSRDPRPSPHVHRRDAGPRHPGDAPRRGREPGDPARRDRQARATTTAAIRRRRCSRCSIPSRTARSTITTSRSTTTSRRCCSSRRRTRCRRFPSRCATGWRSSASPAISTRRSSRSRGSSSLPAPARAATASIRRR